jgi:hypothetical protein
MMVENDNEVDRDADLAKYGIGARQLSAEAILQSGPGSKSAAHAAGGRAPILSRT